MIGYAPSPHALDAFQEAARATEARQTRQTLQTLQTTHHEPQTATRSHRR
jgi:hypothetical protein